MWRNGLPSSGTGNPSIIDAPRPADRQQGRMKPGKKAPKLFEVSGVVTQEIQRCSALDALHLLPCALPILQDYETEPAVHEAGDDLEAGASAEWRADGFDSLDASQGVQAKAASASVSSKFVCYIIWPQVWYGAARDGEVCTERVSSNPSTRRCVPEDIANRTPDAVTSVPALCRQLDGHR